MARFLVLEPASPARCRFSLPGRGLPPRAASGCRARRHFPPLRCQARLAALEALLSSRTVATEDLHELLTHVVDETAAICGDLRQELFQQPGRTRPAEPGDGPRAEA